MRTPERSAGGIAALRRVAVATPACRPFPRTTLIILLLAVAVRLILINQFYIDHWSWRQSDVAAIAGNFYENGFHFAYPQIDWAGNAPGYVGTEFPILPFFAAICYKFLGVHEWIGRSQSIIFFAVSLPFFSLLIRETFGNTAAVWATFFYSFAPLNVFAGRSFMPDVPSLGLAIIGLYFFLRWTCDRKRTLFFLAAIAISLSILIKVTSVVIAAPLLYLAVAGIGDTGRRQMKAVRSRDHRSQLQLLLFSAIVLLPSAIWYWHAWQISEKFYPHHFFGAGGVRMESLTWYWQIARRTITSSVTPILSIMAFIGLFVPQSREQRNSCLFHWWLAGMIAFVIAVSYGNRHPWYQLPLVPIASAFAGAACAFVASKIASRVVAITLSLLLGMCFAVLAFVHLQPLYQSSARQLRDAGLRLEKITAPGSLIIAADGGDPTIFYYARRKGWHFLEKEAIYNGTPSDGQEAVDDLEQLRRRGATYLVFTANRFWWLDYFPKFTRHLSHVATLVEATPEFKIYRLPPG